MKREDTSRLLNEWKSFLNESKLDTDALQKFERLPDPSEIDESIKSIISSLFEMGLKQEDVDDVVEHIKELSPESIEKLDDEFSTEAFGGDLEDDEHLSER